MTYMSFFYFSSVELTAHENTTFKLTTATTNSKQEKVENYYKK